MSHVSGPERLPRWAVWRPQATGHRPSRLGSPGRAQAGVGGLMPSDRRAADALAKAAAAGACGAGLRRAAPPAKPGRRLSAPMAFSNPSR